MYRGTSEGVVKHCIELKSQPVGMERINKNIYVGTMDQMLHCFTAKVFQIFVGFAYTLNELYPAATLGFSEKDSLENMVCLVTLCEISSVYVSLCGLAISP